MARHRAVTSLGHKVSQSIGRIFTVMLWLLGVSGIVLMLWLGASALTGAQMIHLKTGSMSSTMPTGTLAIIIPADAANIQPGDVVTVQRDPASLPVTHRVVSNIPAPESSDSSVRSLVLKGDANTQNDFDPYVVQRVGKVIISVPHAGPVLEFLQRPLSMIILSAIVALLITYAFWPATTSTIRRNGARHKTQPRSPRPPLTPRPSRPQDAAASKSSMKTGAIAVIVALNITAVTFGGGIPAFAAETWIDLPESESEDEDESILTLGALQGTLFHTSGVQAGDTVVWQIRAKILPPETALPVDAATTLELRASGSMVTHAELQIGIWTCSVPFKTATSPGNSGNLATICPGKVHVIQPQNEIKNTLDGLPSKSWRIGTMSQDSPQYFRIQFTVPADANPADTGAIIGLGFTVTGQSKGDLADSGIGNNTLHWLAPLFLTTGILTVLLANFRSKRFRRKV